MTLSLQEETYRVSALCAEIRDLLKEVYPDVWVTGEINRIRNSKPGHCYFELIEKGSGDEIVGKLEAVAWRTDFQRIQRQLQETDQSLVEGQQIRCRGQVDFYPPFGRLQFVVREVDPVFSLGELARRRQETLAALTAAGLLELNKKLELDPLPLRVGLVTSFDSAAYHDFLTTLGESGIGFEVVFVHSAVQGRQAEDEVASALASFTSASVDCVVLIRGGGSRADLAVFDSRRIADAVATLPVPVLTGLGHQIDQSIADLAAHTALKTPTKVAEFLVDRVLESERRLGEIQQALAQKALDKVRTGREALGRARRGITFARYRLVAAAKELDHLMRALPVTPLQTLRRVRKDLSDMQRRLGRVPARIFDTARRDSSVVGARIATRADALVRERLAMLDGWERLIHQLAPERTLERGFSITRDTKGKVLRDPTFVHSGDQITSQLAKGSVTSQVE